MKNCSDRGLKVIAIGLEIMHHLLSVHLELLLNQLYVVRRELDLLVLAARQRRKKEARSKKPPPREMSMPSFFAASAGSRRKKGCRDSKCRKKGFRDCKCLESCARHAGSNVGL